MVQEGEEKPPSLKSFSNDENRENAAQFFYTTQATHTHTVSLQWHQRRQGHSSYTEGYRDMDRDHGPELRVATDAQGGTDRARSLGRPSASVKGNCCSGKTKGER